MNEQMIIQMSKKMNKQSKRNMRQRGARGKDMTQAGVERMEAAV
jgi:hypothetical protein